MTKRTILHIIGQLGVGGAEKQLYLLLKSLGSHYNFVVISYDEKRLDYLEALQSLGINVIITPKKPGFTGGLKFLLELRNIIKRIDPDIVQTWLRSANLWGRIACLISWKKTSLIASIRNVNNFEKKILEILLNRFLAKRTDLIITNTKAAMSSMIQQKIPPQKIKVIYNGIDPKFYNIKESKDKLKERLSVPSEKILVGTIGRLMQQKNHMMFIKVARQILRIRNNVHFVIVGEGELRQHIETLISKFGLSDAFTLTGQRDDIPLILGAFDIFVLTSSWEGLPNVVMEAMCSKLPIVATDVGGVSELVNNDENGYLVASNDIDVMVKNINRLIDDPHLRARFGSAGLRKIEKQFRLEKTYELYSSVYSKLLNRFSEASK